jgi:hypothetical protein
MMVSDGYFVAVYQFRSKQEYIYRTNRIKEIMGASRIIEDAFRDAIRMYPAIEYDFSKDFSLKSFDESSKAGIVLYQGGGNMTILFNGIGDMIEYNKYFSKWLIEHAPGLSPLCGYSEFKNLAETKFSDVTNVIFDSIAAYKKLAQPSVEADVLPITQIDRKTVQPLTGYDDKGNKISRESKSKLDKYDSIKSGGYTKNLDNMVHKKGKESLLAIVYADGNSMGEKVKAFMDDSTGFEDGVNKQRRFTKEVNKVFVELPLVTIGEVVGTSDRGNKNNNALAMRRIVGAGDEITIVCNARKAKEVVDAYFKSLDESNNKSTNNYSACVGVAIFNSHAPFSDIYEIAEQCCESGKRRIKELVKNGKEEAKDYCYFDAYFCRGAITGELDELRERQQAERTKMPYCVRGEDSEHSYKDFENVGKALRKLARTKVKTLRDRAFRSNAELELELDRISTLQVHGLSADDRAMIMDVADFYDIWFSEEENDGENNN